MARWGMVIDLDKCFACQSCTAACRMENNTPVAGPDQTGRDRAILWNEVLPYVEGEYPNVNTSFVPRPCQHCDDPPCVKVCPVQATFINEEGLVLVDYDRCIGCRYCTVACPYQVRYFNWYEPEWPEALKQHLNPDPEVAPRPKGVVEKCTFCFHRIDAAQREGKKVGTEVVTACAEACPAHAIAFGDLEDPESEVSQLLASRTSFRLRDYLHTEPKVYYLPR